MEAFTACLEEIALEGLDGCPIVHLWDLLKQRTPTFPLALDDLSKEFLWRGIVESLDVEFFVLEHPLPHIFGGKEEDKSSATPFPHLIEEINALGIDVDVKCNTYCLVNDEENGICGSCPEYKTRQNVTDDVRDSNSKKCVIPLKQAYDRWSDRLVIVASQKERSKFLFDSKLDSNVFLSEVAYFIVEHIGQARHRGRLQSLISHVDPRTCFYHLKKLVVSGVITKQYLLVTSHVGQVSFTNVLRLKRFDVPRLSKLMHMGEKITDILSKQPGKKMDLVNLRDLFKVNETSARSFKRTKRLLEKGGYIKMLQEKRPAIVKKKVRASKNVPDPDINSSPSKLKDCLCVQLIKPFNVSDSDDEDEEYKNKGAPCYVYEKSLMNQVYDCVEKYGPDGATLKMVENDLAMTNAESNKMLQILEKDGHLKGITVYAEKRNVKRFVAKPYVQKSILSTRIRKEEEKFKAIKESLSSPQASSEVESGGVAQISGSRCLSPTPSTQSIDTNASDDLSEKRGKTYRSLKRKNTVLEFLKKHKVCEGVFPILKVVCDIEAAEGFKTKPDHKVIKRVINELERDGLLRSFKTILNTEVISKPVEFYIDSSINDQDPKVKKAISDAQLKLESANQDLQSQFQPKDAKIKAVKETIPKSRVNKSLRCKFGYLAKFPRMRVLHQYFWQITHGAHGNLRKSGASSSAASPLEPSWNGGNADGADASYDCGWEDTVESTPLLEYGPGWLKLDDALQVMPLSIYCNALGITTEIPGLEEMYNNPKARHTLLKDLPRRMIVSLTRENNCKEAFCMTIATLLAMGLLTARRPFPSERYQTLVHVSAGAILVDTQSSLPGSLFVKEPKDFPFPQKKYIFDSLAAVTTYWNDFKYISLNTPLGMSTNSERPAHRSRWYRFRDSLTEPMLENSIVPPPGDGQGAAGHDSYLYSHLSRNWTLISYTQKCKKEVKTGTEVVKPAVIVPKFVKPTQPTPTAKKTPKTPKLGTKRKRESQGPTPIRVKTKKVQAVGFERKVKKREFIFKRKRTSFTVEQDKMLLICKIVMGLMPKVTLRKFPVYELKTVVEKYCKCPIEKSATQYHKRLQVLMKNCKTVVNVRTYVAEFLADEEFQGLDDFNLPFEETFLATVKKIYDRSRAEESNNLDTSKLVNSLSDLHDNYTLSKLELRKEKDVSLHRSPLTSVEDIRINVASDLIQAICNSKKRQVAAMHAFNCFSEDVLYTAVSKLYEHGMIDRQRKGTGRKHAQEKRATRVAAMRLSLTNSYYRLFDNYSTKLSTFKECMMYQEKILPLETYDPDGNGPMPEVEIDQNDLDGGTTACVLSLLVTNKIKAKLTLPEEIVGISLDEQESIAESGLVEPDAQGPPRTSMPPKALTTVSTSIEQSDQLDSKSQNEASEKSGDARQVKRSVDKKASVRDEKNRHDEDKKQTEKEEGADTNKAPKDRIVGESNIGKRKASSVKPPTKKQKVAKDSGEESVTPPPEPTSRMNVYRVHGEQVSTLFASPYDLPSNNPIITKESTVHCHERDETAASTATLPAQRPSRISLMISRHALRDKVKKTKDYNQQEMTTLNCCPITLTPGTVGSKTDVADVELPRLLHEALGGSTEEAEHLKERTLKTELASKAGFSMKHGSKVPSVVDTLEKFLDSCIKEKKYTDGDVSLTRTIHEAAFNGQEFGISITRLKDVIEQKLEEFCDARYSLQEHLNNLYQSQLLWSVGTFEELVVCHAFVSPWCVDLPKTDLEEITVIPAADANQESENAEKLASDPQKESASKPESFKVISRPWLNLEGNVNKEFMRSVVKCIVCTVMERPGITQDQLVERFIAVVKPTVLEELFTMLESRGCISRHEIVETSSLTLFSCQVPKVVSYWLPEVDAFIKINSILREIENE